MSTSLLKSHQDWYKNLNISSLSFLVSVCETSERYQDAWTLLKELIEKKSSTAVSLSQSEMNYLSVTFRYLFGNLRWSIKVLKESHENEYESFEVVAQEINSYIITLTNKLHELCDEYISVLFTKLIPSAKTLNNYPNLCDAYKLLSNCYRYKCEHSLPSNASNVNELHNNTTKANELYTECINLCNEHLQSDAYSYLSAYLCYSVFQHDILKQYNAAMNTLKTAFDAAMGKIDTSEPANDIVAVLQYIRDNMVIYADDLELEKEKQNNIDDDNDGIDIRKYGRRAKEKRHNPEDEQDMHDLKSDLKKLGLMSQNKNDPNNPMDEIRKNLHELFVDINGEDSGLYKDVIDLILQYEAFIDLSKFKCIECAEYFGCDVFDNLCSECYANKYGKTIMKQKCRDNVEDIAIRIEWDDIAARQRYYNMISMPSLCSIKIYFRILNKNSYRGKYLDVLDENYSKLYTVEKCNSFTKIEDEQNEQIRNNMELNERCVTDFGIIALSAILLRY